MTDLDDQSILSAFGQGESCARKGGYLSDNPHAYLSGLWEVWREGYQYELRMASV